MAPAICATWGIFVTGTTPSRRQVVRAGAWSVPVVAASVAAPAFATSNKADLTKSTAVDPGVKAGNGNGSSITITVTPSNIDGNADTTGLRVEISNISGLKAANLQTGPTGYNTTAPTVSGTTITFYANAQLAGGATGTSVTFTIQVGNSGNSTATVRFVSTGANDVNKSQTIALS